MSKLDAVPESFPWGESRRAAAALTFDLDAESAILSFAPEAASRLSVMSHQAYGPRVGVPRLLRILARQEVRATFFVPGFTADRYPDVVKEVADQGHEIAHHGYLHESILGLSPAEEVEILERGSVALERITGDRPVGYRAPMWETNYGTPAILAKQGFLYDSSLMDDDVPYVIETEAGDLVEIPIQWALDDWEQYAFLPELSGSGLIESPAKVSEMWRLELEAVHREGLAFVLVNHPFLSGRPSRAAALEGLIELMKGLPGLWIATMGELAELAASAGKRVPAPEAPSV